MKDTFGFHKHICTQTTYCPFLQKYWQQTTHNKKWSMMLKVCVQHLHTEKCQGVHKEPQARHLQYHRASQECLRCCSPQKTTSEKIKHCSVDLKKKCTNSSPSLSQHSRMEGSSRITAVRALTSPLDAAWYTMVRSTSSDESPPWIKRTLC